MPEFWLKVPQQFYQIVVLTVGGGAIALLPYVKLTRFVDVVTTFPNQQE